MQRFKRLLTLILIAALFISMTACGGWHKSDAEPLEIGDKYRDFTGELLSGDSFKLSDHEGKVILLNFWATWCGPCVGEMPAFPRLIEKYGEDLVLVAVDVAEDAETVKTFADENGYTINIVLDPEYEICDLYPTDGIPYTLIIGRDGKISNIHLGASDADSMFLKYCDDIDACMN